MTEPAAKSRRAHPGANYGYVVVAASSLVMLVSLGIQTVYGLFLNPLVEEFGWSRATISGAYSLSVIIGGALGIVAGVLTDRIGPRIVVTISGVLVGTGCMLMSQVDRVWELYLFSGFLIGTGMSGLWAPPLSTVARWFNTRRSLMTGIVVSGMTIGQVIAPPIVSRLILGLGWRQSYLAIGAASLSIVVLGAQFMRKHPGVPSSLPQEDNPGARSENAGEHTFREALRTRQFWMVSAAFFSVGIGVFGVMVHLVPHMIELGISEVDAANVQAVVGLVGIPASFLLGGLLGDIIGNRRAFIIGLLAVTAALFFVVPAHQLWVLYLFALVFGAGVGGMTTSESPLVAWLFGLRHHSAIYAAISLGYTLGGALGPVLFGSIFDETGSYVTAFLLAAGFGVICLVLIALLRPTHGLRT